MAVTYANFNIVFRGPFQIAYAEATLDTSYDAGGETVRAGDFGMAMIRSIFVGGVTSGFKVDPIRSTDALWLLKVYASLTPDTNSAVSLGQESSTGRDLSTVMVPLLVVGR